MKSKEYIMHLLTEISNYVLERHPGKMVLSLQQGSDGLHLCVLDDTVRTDGELETMMRDLNASSRPELAEYYGSMAGSDLLGVARLKLIGWQVKHADVTRTAEGTRIDLWLGSDSFDRTSFNEPKKD